MTGIGALNEGSLHADLKVWCSAPGDLFEQRIAGYVIDIVCGAQLIEIQTGGFTAIRAKLQRLLAEYPVTLVYPVAVVKWILRINAAGEVVARRKSPKRGQVADLFAELVRLPTLLAHPNLTLVVALVQVEEVWRDDGQGSWRRQRWSIADRRLLAVEGWSRFQTPADLLTLLPAELSDPFTNADLAALLPCHPALAQKMTYCLRKLDLLTEVGKRGHSLLMQRRTARGNVLQEHGNMT